MARERDKNGWKGAGAREYMCLIGDTGIPCFSKVCFIPLHFHGRPTLISNCFQ